MDGHSPKSASENGSENGNVQLAALVEAARQGRQGGWDGLVERFLPLIQSIVARHGLRGEDADDVSQMVWLRLLENLHQVRDPKALAGWISTTSRNECVNAIRGTRRVIPVDACYTEFSKGQDFAAVCDEAILREERKRALLEALAELPDLHRRLLRMLLEDPTPSYSEISRRLQIPIGSIGPNRARALERLRHSRSLVALREGVRQNECLR